MVHLIMHLPEEAIRGGPVHLRWMYPFERFLGSLKKYVRNRARPEGSIAEAYIVNEALTFCSMYMTGIETKFNRLERNWVDDEVLAVKKISVFENRWRPIGKMTPMTLENHLRNTAEWYILQNCSEIQQYIDSHMKELEESGRIGALDKLQAVEFPNWFRNKVLQLQQQNAPEATGQLVSLSCGSSYSVKSYSGCVVNGVKFLTYNRDSNRITQNSGVTVRGPDNQTYYGVLEDIYELSYINDNSVILFKCKWFDTRPEKKRVQQYKNRISIFIKDSWYENEPFILASQAEQVFYVDDLFNGPNWKVVEHFGHRHIWDIPEAEPDDITVVQHIDSTNVALSVELPEIDTLVWNRPDVTSHVVASDVDTMLKDNAPVEDDDFDTLEEDDDTLEQYIEEELTDSDDDDDINDVIDIQDKNSDDD